MANPRRTARWWVDVIKIPATLVREPLRANAEMNVHVHFSRNSIRVAFCTLGLGFLGSAMAGSSACHPRLYTAMEVVLTDTSEVLVPVTLHGHEAYLVLVTDTGFGMLDRRAVANFGLREELLSSVYRNMKLGDARVTCATYVRNARINTLRYPRLDFLLADALELPPSPSASRPVVGMLGMDPFGIADIELDLANRRVNLYAPNHCAGGVMAGDGKPRWAPLRNTWIHNYYFSVDVDNQPIDTALASSSATSQIHEVAARELFGATADGTYVAKSMRIAGIPLADVPLQLTPNPAQRCVFTRQGPNDAAGYTGCAGPVPLRLGLDVLRRLHIYVAAKERKIYIAPLRPTPATQARQTPDASPHTPDDRR